MKWIAEIFVVCLCLGMGGMYVMNQQQVAKLERLEKALAVQNSILLNDNSGRVFNQQEELISEKLNMGKLDNQGLADTLNYLEKHRNVLLEEPRYSPEEIWKLIKWIKKVHDNQISDLADSLEMEPVSLELLTELSREEGEMELLIRERELLFMLYSRLGGSHWGWSPYNKINISAFPIASHLTEGDTAIIRIQFSNEFDLGAADFYENYFLKIFTDEGEITYQPGDNYAILRLPTDEVLQPGESEGWLSYAAKVQFPRPTGGYEIVPISGKIKVVHR